MLHQNDRGSSRPLSCRTTDQRPTVRAAPDVCIQSASLSIYGHKAIKLSILSPVTRPNSDIPWHHHPRQPNRASRASFISNPSPQSLGGPLQASSRQMQECSAPVKVNLRYSCLKLSAISHYTTIFADRPLKQMSEPARNANALLAKLFAENRLVAQNHINNARNRHLGRKRNMQHNILGQSDAGPTTIRRNDGTDKTGSTRIGENRWE